MFLSPGHDQELLRSNLGIFSLAKVWCYSLLPYAKLWLLSKIRQERNIDLRVIVAKYPPDNVLNSLWSRMHICTSDHLQSISCSSITPVLVAGVFIPGNTSLLKQHLSNLNWGQSYPLFGLLGLLFCLPLNPIPSIGVFILENISQL